MVELEYACEAWDPTLQERHEDTRKSPKKRHEILLAELCSTCQCYRYVGHTWMEDIGREEGGIKINNDVQDTGLEITFSLFLIMLISSHDFLLIK